MSPQQIPLTVQVTFDPDAAAFQSATLYAYVEDVSRADASAQSLSSSVLRDISHSTGDAGGLEFMLEVSVPDPSAHLAVRVHIDLDGDGEYSRDDFITMESYPVLTRGHPNQVTVRVRQI
jgi:hypothetical protein